MQVSHTTRPYNNDIRIIYDILKALPFKKCVKSADFKLCLPIISDLDCFNIDESEFQQSNITSIQIGLLTGVCIQESNVQLLSPLHIH